jgi:phage replication-related protein YjqB (UPF0714/DUF867 family)
MFRRIRSETETAYKPLFIPSRDKFSDPHSREHCSINAKQIRIMGINTRQQVRIERPTENGTTLALYTIISAHYEDPHNVYLDYKDPEDIDKRFGLSSSMVNSFNGKINSQVAAVGLTDAQAEAYSEFIEKLTDDGQNSQLAVIAPHGGFIEEHTDEQAEEVAKQLPSNCVSVWMCKGFKKGGGAFARWHITSTDISEKSFPKLRSIIRRQFKYAIAFHGWDQEKNSICIGGSISYDLKQQIKTAIENAVSGSGIEVAIGGDYYGDNETCPANFNGNDSNNIVNRLSINGGIQIEQSEKAREESYRYNIAKAVVDVIRPKLYETEPAPVV